MSEFVYPRSTSKQDIGQCLDDSDIAEIIIDARERGQSRKMAYTIAVAASGSVPASKRVAAEIDAEIASLEALKPLEYSTGGEFLSAIESKCTHLDSSTWVSFLQQKYGVNTFAELKALLTPEE
jgi:hypothetical protein